MKPDRDITIHEIKLGKCDDAEMRSDRGAAWAVLCFAVSEVNALNKLILFADRPEPDSAAASQASSIQQLTLIRTVSSKLFEVREFFEFRGKYNKSRDMDLRDFGKRAITQFKDIDKLPGYGFAQKVRHETSFHYRIKPVKERFDRAPPFEDSSLFIQDLDANSLFPLGEEVVFWSLVREFTDARGKTSTEDVIQEWAEWSTKTMRLLNKLLFEFFERFIEPNSAGYETRELPIQGPPDIIGLHGTTHLPIFWMPEETQ